MKFVVLPPFDPSCTTEFKDLHKGKVKMYARNYLVRKAEALPSANRQLPTGRSQVSFEVDQSLDSAR